MRELNLITEPDEDEDEGAGVFVDGTIAGRPYRFLLDTGAARSSVLWDDYTSTFASTEQHHSSGVFANASSSEDLITVPELTVGPIIKKNLTLVRTAARAPGIRSLVGMDILKDYCCHFFFDDNRLSFLAEDDPGVNAPLLALFLDSRFHPYVQVEFQAAKANAVWDTGASITVVDMNFVKQHPVFFQEVGHSTGTDASGAQMETSMFIMSASRIGEHDFPPHKVAGVDLAQVNSTLEVPMNLILG
jgi:hypothetical protein